MKTSLANAFAIVRSVTNPRISPLTIEFECSPESPLLMTHEFRLFSMMVFSRAKNDDNSNTAQDTRHKTQDTRHKTQDTRHKTQDTRHKTQDTRHKTQDTRHKTQDTRHKTQDQTTQHTAHNTPTTTNHKQEKTSIKQPSTSNKQQACKTQLKRRFRHGSHSTPNSSQVSMTIG